MKHLLALSALATAFTAGSVLAQDAGRLVPQTPEIKTSNVQHHDSGTDSDYCQRSLGKWFYCESDKPVVEVEKPATPAAAAAPDPSSDDKDYKEFETFKKDMEKARQLAVWNPSDSNLRRYYAYQKATLDKATLFSDNWRRMIWENPDMDYNQVRPISDLGKQTWTDDRNSNRDLFFRGVSDQIGIYYIFRGNCSPCKVQSPIMYNFYQRFGVSIHGISADGSRNEFFPNAKPDRGQLAAWGITQPVTPAYLVFQKSNVGADGQVHPVKISVTNGQQISLRPCTNPKGCLTYVGAGILSVDDLSDRLFVILGTESGKDF